MKPLCARVSSCGVHLSLATETQHPGGRGAGSPQEQKGLQAGAVSCRVGLSSLLLSVCLHLLLAACLPLLWDF